jgi:hypothetical protein
MLKLSGKYGPEQRLYGKWIGSLLPWQQEEKCKYQHQPPSANLNIRCYACPAQDTCTHISQTSNTHWIKEIKEEERWLNGSAPDCKSVVLGSNPAHPQHTANSVSPEVGRHLGWHSTVCWPLRGGRGTYIQQPLKYIGKKEKRYLRMAKLWKKTSYFS